MQLQKWRHSSTPRLLVYMSLPLLRCPCRTSCHELRSNEPVRTIVFTSGGSDCCVDFDCYDLITRFHHRSPNMVLDGKWARILVLFHLLRVSRLIRITCVELYHWPRI